MNEEHVNIDITKKYAYQLLKFFLKKINYIIIVFFCLFFQENSWFLFFSLVISRCQSFDNFYYLLELFNMHLFLNYKSNQNSKPTVQKIHHNLGMIY